MMLIYNMYFFILGFILFLLSLNLFIVNWSILINWSFLSFLSMEINFMFFIDWISLSFMSIVMLISSMIFMYSIQYMENEKFLNRFMYLVLLFVLSMMLMILSPNILSILLGWDGLGLISYCLVIFYQNYNSMNAGMVTVLSNRIGDVALLILIGLLMSYGSWNLFLYEHKFEFILFMLMIAGLTKSAQIPFSSWLPMAMAAPTPVSSLVHSSTLVTAGVYLFFRYNILLMMNDLIIQLILILSSFTMLMSGIMANFEIDLKKIIALSTLSQLALMMSILMLGFNYISFFHLLVHALFKSMLFMCSGVIIHLMNNNQDIRLMGGLGKMFPFLILSFFMCKLSLCGFPFLSGFYSKDLIMELILMNKINMVSMLFLMISTILTVSYTIRLILFIFLGYYNYKMLNFMHEGWYMNYSMLFLFYLSISGGSLLMWMFFKINNLIILNFFLKIFILVLCFIGIILGVLFYFLKFKIHYYFSSMFYLDMIMKYVYLNILMLGKYLYMYMEKGWFEIFSGLGMFKFLYNNMFMNTMNKFYEMFIMLMFFMGIMFLMVMFM